MINRLVQGLLVTAVSAATIAFLRSRLRTPYMFAGKTVVITGGSRGLGLEMARLWAAEGAQVAICARDADEIAEAVTELRRVGGMVLGHVCNVTHQEDVNQFIENVRYQWGKIDVLVNNAGVIQVGPLDCMTLADFRTAMETHFWGPLYATLAVLPEMRRRRQGRIVNISSIGGRISVPHLLPYNASKFALVGLSEGLHAELKQEGIVVTTVTPSMMRTGSPRNADFKGHHRAEYAWFSLGASLPIISIDAREAARRIIEACRRGDSTATVSAIGSLAIRCHGLFPDVVPAVMAGVNSLLPKAGGVGSQSRKGWQSFSALSPSWLTTLNELAAARNHELRNVARE